MQSVPSYFSTLHRGGGIAGTCYTVEMTSKKAHWQLLLLTQLITKFLCLEKEGQDIVKQIQILPGYHEDENFGEKFYGRGNFESLSALVK